MLRVINEAVNEIKALHQQAKQIENVASQGKYMSLVYMNVLFLMVYIIPILYSLVVIACTFFYGPIVLLGLLFSIPFTLFVFWIRTRVYSVMKSNFLSRESLSK